MADTGKQAGDSGDEQPVTEGPGQLGQYARKQLDAARKDPRLGRGAEAMVADHIDYLDEANRVRALAAGAIEGIARTPIPEDGPAGARRAAWERREMAVGESDNGHPHLNALTLVGMFGNVDGLVERLAPAAAEWKLDTVLRAAMNRARASVEAPDDVDPELLAAIEKAAREALREQLPQIPRLEGPAPKRWEKPLKSVGLGPDAEHPIPADMALALRELTALRHVLVHRLGRIDAAALKASPTLASEHHLAVGSFVRINRAQYRRYSAALSAYGAEIHRRLFRDSADFADLFEFDLAGWRGHAYINT